MFQWTASFCRPNCVLLKRTKKFTPPLVSWANGMDMIRNNRRSSFQKPTTWSLLISSPKLSPHRLPTSPTSSTLIKNTISVISRFKKLSPFPTNLYGSQVSPSRSYTSQKNFTHSLWWKMTTWKPNQRRKIADSQITWEIRKTQQKNNPLTTMSNSSSTRFIQLKNPTNRWERKERKIKWESRMLRLFKILIIEFFNKKTD